MIIDLNKIPEEGVFLEGTEPAEILDLTADPFIGEVQPVLYEISAQLASHQLILSGRLATTLDVQCARCAEFFSTTLEDSSFLRAYEISAGMETLDVTEDIREEIILLIPQFPLCGEDCKGRCPHCGRNLNREHCTCAPTEHVGRWGELNRIKF